MSDAAKVDRLSAEREAEARGLAAELAGRAHVCDLLAATLAEIDALRADRDEWCQRHENALACWRADMAVVVTQRDEARDEVERIGKEHENCGVDIAVLKRNAAIRNSLVATTEARLEHFEELVPDAIRMAEWVLTVAVTRSDVHASARRYLEGRPATTEEKARPLFARDPETDVVRGLNADLTRERDVLKRERDDWFCAHLLAREELAEEKRHLLADEERRKLTGDALSAEARVKEVEADNAALERQMRDNAARADASFKARLIAESELASLRAFFADRADKLSRVSASLNAWNDGDGTAVAMLQEIGAILGEPF